MTWSEVPWDDDDADLSPAGPLPSAETVHQASVEAGWAGRRLDACLAEAVPALSRSRLKALILAGAVRDGAGQVWADPAAKVAEGLAFTVAVPAPVAAQPQPQAIPLSVVYEDDWIIVIDKPAGMVVHPAAGNPDGTLVNALLAHCGPSLSGIGGVARPGIVHRLDKDTSGLLVAAKTEAAHRHLTAQFADRSLSREYQAVVRGCPMPAEGTVDAPIARHPRDRQRMAVVASGRPAVTHYRLVARFATASLLDCRLETGRTHQIRVHLAQIGHPVIGDRVYGRAPRKADPPAIRAFARQALHAVRLKLRHPADDAPMEFQAPLPDDIRDLIKDLSTEL
ncbi:MAG: RluA family pseudouridine synthase [Rhodospirillaceae bacterium]|nr:RluA family pseudouridine synthase [Rhodospirillaceae bacterium]